MRELKFRARGVDGKWWIGELNPAKGNVNLAWFFSNLYADALLPKTLGEYTGLKDKNGTEIYEGDLLQSNPDSGGRIRQVIHDEYTGGYRFNTGADITRAPNWEVIGNIFENGDLLE